MKQILLSFFLFSNLAFGQKTDERGQWKILQESNYSIKYPSNWQLNQSGQMGTSFILFSPTESAQDTFLENVNLLVQDLAGMNLDLDKYTSISENQIKTMIANSNLLESKRIKNDKSVFHKLVYTGDQGILKLKFEQYYYILNDKAYVLTLTCEQNKFVQFKEIGERILNSFVLTK